MQTSCPAVGFAAILLLATCACLGSRAQDFNNSSPDADTAERSVILVHLVPSQPFIERNHDQQITNIDLLVRNTSHTKYRLVAIRLKVYDRSGTLEVERELTENGTPPALAASGQLLLPPAGVIDIYQPFHSFDMAVDLYRMRFELMFMKEGNVSPPVVTSADATVTVEAHPRAYSPESYCLPLNGLLLVHDGHDFDSHHRRYDLAKRFEADPNTAVSANLYAYDFMRTDGSGILYRGDAGRKENWLSYGQPIFAPAAAIVVQAVSDIPENTFGIHGEAQIPAIAEMKDPLGFGNHVALLHSDGRVSWLLHMQPGSVAVKNGDRVKAGQLLGRVGFSGDSLFPHLHYNVTIGSIYPSQGVPSYFKNFVRVLGSRSLRVPVGSVDSGDLIESRSYCAREVSTSNGQVRRKQEDRVPK